MSFYPKNETLPAGTVNLLLDNLTDFITASGLTPTNNRHGPTARNV